MGEFIYSFIQTCFIVAEIYIMIKRYQTRNDSNMNISINAYSLMSVDLCLIYFIMRSLFG